MSTFFKFIATRTSYATTIPLRTPINELTRRIRGALAATSYPTMVGELKEFPLSAAVPGFLLCDGSEVAKRDFPELDAYLDDNEGAPVNPLNFVLPDFVGVNTPAPTYPAQTVDTGGTVSTGGATTAPTEPGQTGGTTGGNIVSGGRPRVVDEYEF